MWSIMVKDKTLETFCKNKWNFIKAYTIEDQYGITEVTFPNGCDNNALIFYVLPCEFLGTLEEVTAQLNKYSKMKNPRVEKDTL